MTLRGDGARSCAVDVKAEQHGVASGHDVSRGRRMYTKQNTPIPAPRHLAKHHLDNAKGLEKESLANGEL